MRDEVDIVEFDEKYYLFGMKFEADPRRRPISGLILENTVNLGRKIKNRDWFEAMTFFFRDHCILRTKSALPGTILSNGHFLKETSIFRR